MRPGSMNEARTPRVGPRWARVLRGPAGRWIFAAATAAAACTARAETEPARAGLLVVTAADAPAAPARARWIASFEREGYVVRSASLARTNTYARLFTTLARMRVSLRDDALLVVIADAPARLSGLEGSESAVEWSSMPPAPNRPDPGLKMDVMETLVSWASPPAGRLIIFSMQPTAAAATGAEAASRAAFQATSHGPRRWMAWPAEPGKRIEGSAGGMSLFESCLADADVPARLLRPEEMEGLMASVSRRVQALSGGRQQPLFWSSPGTEAPASADDLRNAIGVLAEREGDADAWLRQAVAAWSDGYPRAALGLASAAERLPGDAQSPFRAGLLRGNIRLDMGDAQSLRFELANLAERFERSRADGVVRYEYAILRGEAEEAGGQSRDAAAAYGEAWSVRMALPNPPPSLDLRLHTGLGRLASDQGRNEEARRRFEQAAGIADQLPEVGRMWSARFAMDRAEWHARIGEWEAAQAWCARAMEQAADYPGLHEPLIRIVGAVAHQMALAGQIEPAQSLITRARNGMMQPGEGESAEWLRTQIRLDMASGRMSEAVGKLKQIPPGERAGDADWAELEARVLVSEGRFAQAAEQLKTAIRLMRAQGAEGERIQKAIIAQADGYLRGGQPELAIAACDDVLGSAGVTDAQRVEVLRTAIQALHRMGSTDKLVRYADMYLKLNMDPAASLEEAEWLMFAADTALESGPAPVALGLIRGAIYAAREAGVDDPLFWVMARETHARALPRRSPEAWAEALEALRLLELCHRQISEDSARLCLLLSDIAREQGDLARSRAYLSEARTFIGVPHLVRDPKMETLARQLELRLSRGTEMPPPAGLPPDHLRYESAETAR